ncbi:4543_t:CDS:1, partial [Entrophospora sp. SA101]
GGIEGGIGIEGGGIEGGGIEGGGIEGGGIEGGGIEGGGVGGGGICFLFVPLIGIGCEDVIDDSVVVNV